MTAPTRDTFPPHDMTDEERAATVGRYVENPTPVPDPPGEGDDGREQPAPPGEIYVRAETFEETSPEEPEAEPDEESEEEADEPDDDPENQTVAELKAELDELGVAYDPKARKADLIALVREAVGG